ncbi:serine hydrolase domain-containing protein [Streptomyces sp. 549]|uniref:serine hydrolase domain-containing protein n=1 Tax=Streptomyces sp. 549 TaxID=3049076 RepID=UPI0024C37A61|nr:serine hydrolase domain-containing protein [Streptomyces sp. 549]MDK1476025.1 serine hydrolase domain-containing protein [Streptomyces sp. 549]
MVNVQGTVADGFEPVRDAFRHNLAARGDRGAAVTVYRDGRPVVDLWGGLADAEAPGDHTAPTHDAAWRRDTAQVMRSATKGPSAAVLHLLHQRGTLDPDAPVGTYWPEFKANGKERVLVRHLLSHRAGLPVLDTPLTPAQALDGVSGPEAVAAQAPEWEPGTAHGYHPHTWSWLLGELVLRVTGEPLGRWFAEEIAEPLGLDLWIGLPAAQEHRVGRVAEVAAPAAPPAQGLRVRAKPHVADAYRDPASLTRRAFGAIEPLPDENAAAYRAACLAASAGVATARSLARFYAALIGHVDGRRLYTAATLTAARTEESAGPDRVLVVPTRFGSGYMLHGPASPMLSPASFGHPGRGGSLGFADADAGIAFGYVTGSLQKSVTSDPRAQALVRAVRTCLTD